jgi:Uma2 family endonuclease
MPTVTLPPRDAPADAPPRSLADLVRDLGAVPLGRIALRPAPGTATEADVLRPPDSRGAVWELVDGALVEKARGFYEARAATVLGYFLEQYLAEHDLGFVVGPDAFMRLAPGLVRAPDVSVVLWSQLPGRRVPREPVSGAHPDLAVEILSAGNTEAEMRRKVGEYFAAGARLVWLIHPQEREVRAFSSPDAWQTIDPDGVLTGDPVLPGFRLDLPTWFARVEGTRP